MSSALDAATARLAGDAVAATFTSTRPAVSVVIPTRNEAGNIVPLMDALAGVLAEHGMEVIFVDDSDDGTDAVIRDLSPASHLTVDLIHRVGNERVGGLGGAVVAGMERASADWICVMDADLQHPPALVSELFERAGRGDVDIVVASRFTGGGSADEFGPLRRLLSRMSTAAAERLFARQLSGITDPMSGFFMVRRSALELDDLRPKGFKILLEVLVRTRHLRKAEVPFSFGVRHSGESKASAAEGARYLGQLWRLRFADVSARFGRFGLVGATGLVVNTLALALLSDVLGMWYLAAAILATQVSTLWNFVLTDRWVFGQIDPALGLGGRLLSFFVLNNTALLLRVPLLYLLVDALGANYLVANVVSLLALCVVRFGVADSMIWAAKNATARFNYDIHGIISVASDGVLPELERFRVRTDLSDPTIRVRIGRVTERGTGARELDGNRTLVHYVEKFGNLGFGAELTLGERIDITAAPLLRRSPHVLYTNIVEPVLRWAFVERGYALVHAACMASEHNGFLITARTDTGKTTTALKTLDSLPFSFLSDDLTLLTPDGRVLTYPKPLTISRHTLSSVKTPLLTRKERTKLIVQSRLHSKSGRLFGLIIAKTGMPAATMNALVQMVVPPPKFQVDRLVPHVAIRPEAQVAGMAIIQREGEEGAVLLEEQEAMDILLANCEDAYGFPPYPIIQQWLHSRNGMDLRTTERQIITAALSGKPTQLLRSYERNWYRMFPAMIERAVGANGGPARLPVTPALDSASAGT
jgi:glycosyltransferase involved in cell wall biosynthesis